MIAYAKANPGKARLRVGRRRIRRACCWRAIQDDGRPQHRSRPLSGTRARTSRPARRPAAGHVRRNAFVDRAQVGTLRALAVPTTARSEATRCPDRERIPAGIRSEQVLRNGVPRQSSAEMVYRLNREINAALANPVMTSRPAELGGSPLPGARRFRQASRGRDREMGPGD